MESDRGRVSNTGTVSKAAMLSCVIVMVSTMRSGTTRTLSADGVSKSYLSFSV